MRLFIAIELSEEVKEYLYNLKKKVKEAKISWVPKKNLHLTLKYLGEVKEEDLEKVKERLEISTKSFTATLTQLGFFPSKESPRIIWVGLEPENKICALQQKIDAEFLDLFPSEQTFTSHITLGRVKGIRREKTFQQSLQKIDIPKMSFEIDKIHLLESVLYRGGSPKYHVIKTITLS